MAIFKPYKILKSNLASLPIQEGQFICLMDSEEMYLDISDTVRMPLLSNYVKEVKITEAGVLEVTTGNAMTARANAVMGGASAESAGKAGLVPQPAIGDQEKYLRADGTWGVPLDTNNYYTKDEIDNYNLAFSESMGNLQVEVDKKSLVQIITWEVDD